MHKILTVCIYLMFVCKLVVCKAIQFSADSTILCLSVYVLICFVYLSICSSYWWCSMIPVCSWLFGTLLKVCPCVLLVCKLPWLFIYFSSLLQFLALFGALYGESNSYWFNILSWGSTVYRVSCFLRYCSSVMGVVLMCLLFLLIMQPVFVIHIV